MNAGVAHVAGGQQDVLEHPDSPRLNRLQEAADFFFLQNLTGTTSFYPFPMSGLSKCIEAVLKFSCVPICVVGMFSCVGAPVYMHVYVRGQRSEVRGQRITLTIDPLGFFVLFCLFLES